MIEFQDQAISIGIELVDLDTDTAIWVDRFSGKIDAIHELRALIVERTAASIEARIPQHEAQLARLQTTESLDAWSAFHLGMVNMYRFSEEGTKSAVNLFHRATMLDPGFARAHAGLSFAQFQNVFNGYGGVDRGEATKEVFASAERGLELDPQDPFCNFVHGRTHFLTGDIEQSHGWLDRAVEINPSFAQGHYTRGLAAVLAGLPEIPIEAAARAASLSPLDPFLFGFFGVPAFAHLTEGDYESAAALMNRAASSPGSLVVMDLAAAAVNDLAGNRDTSAKWAARARARNPKAGIEYFFKALPFQDPDTRHLISRSLERCGFTDRAR